jgi:hypothetical protein
MARKKNEENCAICHNLAFFVARMSHVGIWGNKAFVWVPYDPKKNIKHWTIIITRQW